MKAHRGAAGRIQTCSIAFTVTTKTPIRRALRLALIADTLCEAVGDLGRGTPEGKQARTPPLSGLSHGWQLAVTGGALERLVGRDHLLALRGESGPDEEVCQGPDHREQHDDQDPGGPVAPIEIGPFRDQVDDAADPDDGDGDPEESR
jgi:hypothetical protein